MTRTSNGFAFDRAKAYAAKMSGAIEGNHGDNQTLDVANKLVWDFALNESEALAILREFNARCTPPWSEIDLLRKIRSAMQQPHQKPRGNMLEGNQPSMRYTAPAQIRVPIPIDPATAIENFLKGFRCVEADLVAASPWKIPPLLRNERFHHQGVRLIDALFEPGELVNVVTRSIIESGRARPGDSGLTLERNEWERKLLKDTPSHPGGCWLRMNPLDGNGVADANVVKFRFALVEMDSVPFDLQLALLARLRLPIAAIMSSGGKSAHAWVAVDAPNVEDYKQTVGRMLALLAKFGVDGKNKNPSRLSRLPGVVREIGAHGDGRQRLIYLNPEPKQQAIL